MGNTTRCMIPSHRKHNRFPILFSYMKNNIFPIPFRNRKHKTSLKPSIGNTMFSFPNTFCHKKHNSFLISSFIENTAVVTPHTSPHFLACWNVKRDSQYQSRNPRSTYMYSSKTKHCTCWLLILGGKMPGVSVVSLVLRNLRSFKFY